jgi:hypothetical protein
VLCGSGLSGGDETVTIGCLNDINIDGRISGSVWGTLDGLLLSVRPGRVAATASSTGVVVGCRPRSFVQRALPGSVAACAV